MVKKKYVALGLGLAVAAVSYWNCSQSSTDDVPLTLQSGAFKFEKSSPHIKTWEAQPEITPLFEGKDQITGIDGTTVYHCRRPKSFSDILSYYGDIPELAKEEIWVAKANRTSIDNIVTCKIFTDYGYFPFTFHLEGHPPFVDK